MPIAAAAPGTLVSSLQQRLLRALSDNDPTGFQLLLELTLAQLGADDTTALLAGIPGTTHTALVPRALQFLHGSSWINIASNIVLAAAHQLAEAGAIPGQDFSYSRAENGEPILHMSSELYESIEELNPDSLHLIRAFLLVQTA